MPELLAENEKLDTILSIGGTLVGMLLMAVLVLIESELNNLVTCGTTH